ncbi:Sodium/hydrogen exchanger 9B2 [Holothuria leucospilota]|uniref:Sodium/hydrogen exchanger 9B2 n=1 Tax=Holothuria leucospilota TaxID=206669 RepID=A0A9Q0YHD3_HOLLE|nr:Sodium/hydrogen exchanger 9B2 [Holothuria leucospilota]
MMSFLKQKGSFDLTQIKRQNLVEEQTSWPDSSENIDGENEKLQGKNAPASVDERKLEEEDEEEVGVSWAKLCFTIDDEGSVTMVDGDLYPSLSPSQTEDYNLECQENSRYACCLSCTKPLLTKYNPLPPNPSYCQRLKYAFMCPPHGTLASIITWCSVVLLLWAVLFSVLGDDVLPGGNIFALYVLVVTSMVAGLVIQKLFRLPPLLGMLMMGFILRNVPYVDIATDIDPSWSSVLRSMSLVIILLKAGLGIDTTALRKLGCVCFRLSFIPCLVEASAVAVVGYIVLKFPWDWAFMLGFIVTALSPAVVVPSLLDLQDEGRGVAKGIPTLGVAACSLDNVLAISAFGLVMGISFSSGNIYFNIFRGPIEVVIGLAYGFLTGVLFWYFPAKEEEGVAAKRTVLLFCGGVLAVFGSNAINFPGAGALGCITVAVVSAYKWKEAKIKIQRAINLSWVLFEPILYGLIGAEVSIGYLNGSTVGLGLLTILVGVIFRIIATIFSTACSGLTTKERVFMAFAWLPKATVQAALGPVALETVKEKSGDEQLEEYAIQLLTIAVLSILATAPIGAALISIGGKKFLQKSVPVETASNHSSIPGVTDPQTPKPNTSEL